MTPPAAAAALPERRDMAARFPAFPWDTLAPAAQRAGEHPDGIVDLSIGTPVDPTPTFITETLGASAQAPGYPLTAGTARLREAIGGYLSRRWGVAEVGGVLPLIGTKEFVGGVPALLGLGAGDVVVLPELAYPTYAIGALAAGATPLALADPTTADPAVTRLVWVNSPGNPSGAMLPVAEQARIVNWARNHRIPVIFDECYLEFAWDAEPVSALHRDIVGDDPEGVLVIHSLSKRSNMAGYRGGFVAGDAVLVDRLLQARKHLGFMVPLPIQAAMVAALADQDHVVEQRDRYERRRTVMRRALVKAGFTIDDSQGSLYLWVTRGEDCWDTVAWLAELGILVAPGSFYGPAGEQHVRVALTSTDERIDAAAARLRSA